MNFNNKIVSLGKKTLNYSQYINNYCVREIASLCSSLLSSWKQLSRTLRLPGFQDFKSLVFVTFLPACRQTGQSLQKRRVFVLPIIHGLLAITIVFTSCEDTYESSKKVDSPVTQGETTNGLYLGLIGFNEKLNEKGLNILTSTNSTDYYSFIDILQPADGTVLYPEKKSSGKGNKAGLKLVEYDPSDQSLTVSNTKENFGYVELEHHNMVKEVIDDCVTFS